MKIIMIIISHIILNVKMNIVAAYHTDKLNKSPRILVQPSLGYFIKGRENESLSRKI